MSRVRMVLLLGVVAVFAAACGDAGGDGPGVRSAPAVEAAELLDDPEVKVLDIRTSEELGEARLPRVDVHADFYAADFEAQLAELDREATYLMYCRSGSRSGETVALLEELGFKDVTNVSGGIIEWSEQGLPLTSGPR